MESQLAPLKEFLTEIIRPIVNSAVQEAMPKPSEKKRLRTYTVVEACEILKVSKPTLYDYFNYPAAVLAADLIDHERQKRAAIAFVLLFQIDHIPAQQIVVCFPPVAIEHKTHSLVAIHHQTAVPVGVIMTLQQRKGN